jgi:hypothetical protein
MQIEISTENLRGSYKKLTKREYWRVYWLNKTGHGPGVISTYVGMNRETVKSVLKKLKISDSPLPLKGGGRPKKITERAGRHVERLIREGLFITYNMLQIYLMDASINVSRPTVIACVRDLGFGSYYAAHKSRLTDKHKERRLPWAQQRVNWTEEQWRCNRILTYVCVFNCFFFFNYTNTYLRR